MYISIQKNIYCEPCKKCGARPVVEQFPNSKFRVVCPTDSGHYQSGLGKVDVESWNSANTVVNKFRKVS